jgi:hypothetical protein
LEKKQNSGLWKWLIKILLSAFAIGWIAQKINFQEALETVASASVLSLVVAIILYNLSQFVGAIRLNSFLSDSALRLKQAFVTRLYYRGMFYNLFLPGGIGGDGFKVYILNKRYGASVKTLIKAHVFDRVSGLAGLIALFLGMLLLITIDEDSAIVSGVAAIALLGIYPVHFLVLKFIGHPFTRNFVKTSVLSFVLQSLQVISVYVMLRGMGVDGSFPEYAAVFLLSSVATVIPVTLGGLGAREMTFVLLAPYTSIDPAAAVGFSLLFFIVSTLSSLPGIFIGKFDTRQAPGVQLNSSR